MMAEGRLFGQLKLNAVGAIWPWPVSLGGGPQAAGDTEIVEDVQLWRLQFI